MYKFGSAIINNSKFKRLLMLTFYAICNIILLNREHNSSILNNWETLQYFIIFCIGFSPLYKKFVNFLNLYYGSTSGGRGTAVILPPIFKTIKDVQHSFIMLLQKMINELMTLKEIFCKFCEMKLTHSNWDQTSANRPFFNVCSIWYCILSFRNFHPLLYYGSWSVQRKF
jgi:hypothetical protein